MGRCKLDREVLKEEQDYFDIIERIEDITGENLGGPFGVIAPRREAAIKAGLLNEFNRKLVAMWEAQGKIEYEKWNHDFNK